MTKVRQPRKKSEKQLLVEALLGPNTKNCKWPLEMKMVGQLLSKVPDPKFWFYFAQTRKYPTLIYLLADMNSTNLVYTEYVAYTKNKPLEIKSAEPVKLHEEKVGEDIIVERPKFKTLRDFLQ